MAWIRAVGVPYTAQSLRGRVRCAYVRRVCVRAAGPRRLLLHKREIRKLEKESEQRGLTIVPLRCYFNEQNRMKVEIGLAKGKKNEDKRATIKERDQKREISRQLKVF